MPSLATHCPIEPDHPAHINNQRYSMPVPNVSPMTFPSLHRRLSDAKTKADMLAALLDYASSQGALSGLQPDLREKLLKAAGR